MKKSELKTGMLVKLSDGTVAVVVKGFANTCYGQDEALLNVDNGCYISLCGIDDDTLKFRRNSDYDIVEVRECEYIGDVFRIFGMIAAEKVFNNAKLLWKRNISIDKAKKAEDLVKRIAKLTADDNAIQEELKNAQDELEALLQ